mmetsp:Transcript_15634/g.39670  ORF Transcript_15634/g.39670 Transcript_15634/m.39670 type:complete len:202 (-) Transcript_15634:206-811(-)
MLLEGFFPVVLDFMTPGNAPKESEDFATVNKALFALSSFLRSHAPSQARFLELHGGAKLRATCDTAVAAIANDQNHPRQVSALSTIRKCAALYSDLMAEEGSKESELKERLRASKFYPIFASALPQICRSGVKVEPSQVIQTIDEVARALHFGAAEESRTAVEVTPCLNFVEDSLKVQTEDKETLDSEYAKSVTKLLTQLR